MSARRYAESEAAELTAELKREYDRIVAAGNTPQFAMMCIHRKAPNPGHSDQAFNRSARKRMNGMSDHEKNRITQLARQAGINTDGKYYVGRLGRYTDPLAWCSTVDDVKAAARKKNLTVDGVVSHTAIPTAPVQGPALAEDIVQRESKKLLMKDGELRAKVKEGKVKAGEIRERVIAKHGRKRLVYGG